MLGRTWHLETFIGEPLRLTLRSSGNRVQQTAQTGHDVSRWIESLVFSPNDQRRRELESVYKELTGRNVPHQYSPFELSGESWRREITRVLESAVASGQLHVEPALRPRVAVRREPIQNVLGPAPETPVQETSTWFEVRFVDELGKPLDGVEVAFTSLGSTKKAKTNGDGVARFDGLSSSFGSARVVDQKALGKTLDERWSKPRTGERFADAPLVRRFFFSENVPDVGLESETRTTVVVQPTLGKLFVELWDKRGKRRHVDTSYTIQGPETFEGRTDAEGRLLHENVPGGDYTLTLTQEFPEELKLSPETYEVPLVVLSAGASSPQIRRQGAFPRCTMSRLRGLMFDTNKTFLLPTALPALRQIREHYERHNPSKLLVVGHTDTTGEPGVNDPLSQNRAKSVKQYLEDDVDGWLENYDAGVPQKQRWGPREDRLMMLKLSGYETRPVEQSNVTWFQERHNQLVQSGAKPGRSELKVDGLVGPKTRTELIYEYMLLDGVALKEQKHLLIDIQTHGCGANFPLDKTGLELDSRAASERNGERDRTDRRVELFFFDAEFGPIPAPTSAKGEEYLLWRKLSDEDTDENVEGVTQKATVLEVPSAHFRTGSAVLLPEGESPTTGAGTAQSSVGMLAMALRFNEERPGHSLLVAGHADSVGSDKSNDKLSEKRAELLHAVLTGKRDKFAEIANETGKVSDWKQIFRWASGAVPGFEAAAPTKIDDDAASGKGSATAFQNAYNENKTELGISGDDLKPDGIVGKKTWGAIFDLYQWNMAEELGEVEDEEDLGGAESQAALADAESEAGLDESTKRMAGLQKLQALPSFLPTSKPFVGFGEHFPADGVTKDNAASEGNRRVELLFFEQGHEPDVAILNEAPDVTELYQTDAFEKTEIKGDSAKEGAFSPPFRIFLRQPRRSSSEATLLTSSTGKFPATAPARTESPGVVVVEFANVPRRRTYTLKYASAGTNPSTLFEDAALADAELAQQASLPKEWSKPFDELSEPTNNASDDPLVRFDEKDRPLTLQEEDA